MTLGFCKRNECQFSNQDVRYMSCSQMIDNYGVGCRYFDNGKLVIAFSAAMAEEIMKLKAEIDKLKEAIKNEST